MFHWWHHSEYTSFWGCWGENCFGFNLFLCRQDYSQTHVNDDPNLPVQSLPRRQLVFKSAVLNCWIMRWRARLQIVLLSDPFLYLIYNTAHIPIFIIQFGFILALFSKSQHLVWEEILFTLRSLSDVWKEANFWEAIYEVVPHEYPVEFCHRQIKGRASRWRRRLEMKGGYEVRRERATGITRQEHACFVHHI